MSEADVDLPGFNSSVGILSVGTYIWKRQRNDKTAVSIPQSEFCPLGLSPGLVGIAHERCFNSSVGILSVGTQHIAPPPLPNPSFNSSVGILSVGT